MAVRNKKKASLEQASQDALAEDICTPTESAQAQLVVSNSEVIADYAEDSINYTVSLDADSSEVTMMTDSPEIQEAVEADDPVESVINLEPNLSIQNVVKLYDKLKKSYAAYDAIEIDASHVNSIDTATLQLFVALKKDAMKQKKEVEFFQPSARFIESAKLLDLLEILDITYI
jgi:anti-anti-sigma regulatory factor